MVGGQEGAGRAGVVYTTHDIPQKRAQLNTGKNPQTLCPFFLSNDTTREMPQCLVITNMPDQINQPREIFPHLLGCGIMGLEI